MDETFIVSFVKNVGFCVQDKDTYKIYKMETWDQDQVKMLYDVLTERCCKILNTTQEIGRQ